MLTDTGKSENTEVLSLPFGAVSWTGGLMKETEDRVMKHTVFQLKRMFDDKDISHAVENFRICAGEASGEFDGSVFCDGDFYKFLEAAVYTAYTLNDEGLKKEIDDYISLIGRAQQKDGYISTKQIIGERTGKASRNSDINDFEVYNMGHLFTSACLHFRITGKSDFLDIAKAAAGYLEELYLEAERTGEVRTAVCPSHYMGLVELYRVTGDERYLKLAKKAIALRDSVKNGLDDNQDRLPLKSHKKIIGHAVRSNYLYAGLADLCIESKDEEYERVLNDVWNDLVRKKLYITGGCGALYNGASPYGNFFNHQLIHQAYGYEYQLPNVTAYNETCASVGLVMWALRMFMLSPKVKYLDMIERAWLNVNLASVSLDGLRFFYENMLRRTKSLDYELIWPLKRTDYLISYCCPPNIARMLSQSMEYAYFIFKDKDEGEGIVTGLYGENRAEFRDVNGGRVRIAQRTDYPYTGRIAFDIEAENEFFLYLRLPAWAKSGRVSSGREPLGRELSPSEFGDFLKVSVLPGKSAVCLELDMPVTFIRTNPMVEEDTAQICVMKGPVVYCCESADIEGGSFDDVYLSPGEKAVEGSLCIEGIRVPTIELAGIRLKEEKKEGISSEDRGVAGLSAGEGDPLNEPLYTVFEREKIKKEGVGVRFIPYFAWDNRGEGEMRIWMPFVV